MHVHAHCVYRLLCLLVGTMINLSPSPTPSRPTPLCPTPPACCDAPPPLRATHPARGPRPPVRGHHRPYAFSIGLLSDTLTLHAARGFLAYSVAVLHFVFVACDWLVASTLRVRASFRVVVCQCVSMQLQSGMCGDQSKVTTTLVSYNQLIVQWYTLIIHTHYTRV
jgi:hypothetical protein